MWKAVAGAAALALVATGCSGGGGGTKSAVKTTVKARVEVTRGAVGIASARLDPPVVVDDAVRNQMLDTVKRYIQAATIDPLRTGRGGPALAPLFTASAATRVQGSDRAVLVDEGLPSATGDITAKTLPVAITVLADQTGNLVLATAEFDVSVGTQTAHGPVKIRRVGQLTLAPDAGIWKIAGFDLSVRRDGKGITDTAKTKSSTTTSAKG